MRIHLVNPSDVSFGVAIITPRWLYVLAAATPPTWGDPILTDETLEAFDPARLEPGDVVGIGIHTANALRGYDVGRLARARGAHVVYGGIHATLYPDEAFEFGGADAVVKGDGDAAWAVVLRDCADGGPERIYDGGRLDAPALRPARWDLMPRDSLHVGVGADGARLSEALLVLLGVAHRRPGAAPADRRCGRRGDR